MRSVTSTHDGCDMSNKKTSPIAVEWGGLEGEGLLLDELSLGLVEPKLQLLGIKVPNRRSGSLVEALVAAE